MFPLMTDSRPNTRSLRALVREAVDSALEFATLGAASVPREPRSTPAPTAVHPHRRQLGHRLPRRPGSVAPRPQVCTTPVHRPAPKA